LVQSVERRLEALRGRIAASGRDPAGVRIVAVTKGFGVAAVDAALAVGLYDLGENFAGELLDKAGEVGRRDDAVRGEPSWHFLGAVQRNKVARLAPLVACWQGVDRLAEGEAIARHAPGARVLVEVDCTGLPGRGGVPLDQVASLVEQLSTLDLDVAGLMTVAPPGGGDPARRAFERVAGLVADLGLSEASMGMSDDLDEALVAGSTMVRVGRGRFGPRPSPAQVPQ
jgi:uncharacterized pyridoxal phosphate-containing UPF0001 family protein